jgi:hypothetical protein
MSTGEETHPTQLAEETVAAFERITQIDTAAEPLRAEKEATLQTARDKLMEFGIPPDAKLVAAALLNTDVRNAFEAQKRFKYLEALEATIEKGRGQPVAWASKHEEVTMWQDPGPNETAINQYLNIGILPPDAALHVDASGYTTVPVKEVESINIYMIGDNNDVPWTGELFPSPPPAYERHLCIPVIWNAQDDGKQFIYVGEQEVRVLMDKADHFIMRDSLAEALDRIKLLAEPA